MDLLFIVVFLPLEDPYKDQDLGFSCWNIGFDLTWDLTVRINGRRVAREAAVIPIPGSTVDHIASFSISSAAKQVISVYIKSAGSLDAY